MCELPGLLVNLRGFSKKTTSPYGDQLSGRQSSSEAEDQSSPKFTLNEATTAHLDRAAARTEDRSVGVERGVDAARVKP